MLATGDLTASEEKWYWWPGHSLTFKATGKDTGDMCTWMLVENSPREGVPFHKHLYEDESFYVIDGQFEITIGDKTVVGGPGTYVFGPRQVQHRWTNVGERRGRLINVFTPSGLENFFLAAAIPITSSSQQPSVDMAAMNARMKTLREKFGMIRTGPTKYPRSDDPAASNPTGDLKTPPPN
jgi:quercetin dioxygenase-like cupin family protein